MAVDRDIWPNLVNFGTLPSVPALPVIPSCPDNLGCSWASNYRKHWPHRDLKPNDTRSGPAKYLWGTAVAEIRKMETETVRTGAQTERSPHHTEYMRPMAHVIGWDRGEDATISFAECSGGTEASRTYHGRPLAPRNLKAREPK